MTSPVVWGLLLLLAAVCAYSGTAALIAREGGWVWDVFKGYVWALLFAGLALDLRTSRHKQNLPDA
jgi:hypothetical protein